MHEDHARLHMGAEVKKRPSDDTPFNWRAKPPAVPEFVPAADPPPEASERIDVLLAGKRKDPQKQSGL